MVLVEESRFGTMGYVNSGLDRASCSEFSLRQRMEVKGARMMCPCGGRRQKRLRSLWKLDKIDRGDLWFTS